MPPTRHPDLRSDSPQVRSSSAAVKLEVQSPASLGTAARLAVQQDMEHPIVWELTIPRSHSTARIAQIRPQHIASSAVSAHPSRRLFPEQAPCRQPIEDGTRRIGRLSRYPR